MHRNGYRLTFELFDTEAEAIAFCNERKKLRRKATATPWSSRDGSEHKFIVWFYI